MKIDVSDLFDHLYDVAIIARSKFEISQSIDEDDFGEWQDLCETLSNELFLPACANRAFGLTHCRISPDAVKKRIITEQRPRTGDRVFYCRYQYPYFHGRPEFVSKHRQNESWSGRHFRRPDYPLVLWLGKQPPEESELAVASYPLELDLPKKYFVHTFSTIFSKSPLNEYFEMHGDWCLRHIQQEGPRFFRAELGGVWQEQVGFCEIHQDFFETMWEGATSSPESNT